MIDCSAHFGVFFRMRPTRLLSLIVGGAALFAATACVPSSATPDTMPSPTEGARWPVKTQEHVDTWLHGFAMISNDTSTVPLFRRGYRDSMTVIKNRANAFTALDANRQELATRLANTPALQNAQFLVFSFPTWDALAQSIELFLRAEGNPQRATDQQSAAVIGFLGAQFPTPADRTWLRKFFDGVTDERKNFYTNYWTTTMRERNTVLVQVTSLWDGQYKSRFERFLNSTQQRNGEFVVSLPLGPEGRAADGAAAGLKVVAVPLPGRTTDARESILVYAHEVVGSLAGTAVNDNTTPAEKRMGSANTMVAFAQVRGGALLLENIAPELVTQYVRYYLTQSGKRVGALDTAAQRSAALAAAFPLPTAVVDGIKRQIEIALGGI